MSKCLYKAFQKTIHDTLLSNYSISVDEACRILNIDEQSEIFFDQSKLKERCDDYIKRNVDSPYIQSKIYNSYKKLCLEM